MGAPEVIAAPSKSYVVINSYKSDRSLPSKLCDLGRVSNIAAAVTLPRTANLVTRNNATQNVKSFPQKKRPITDAMLCLNSFFCCENMSTEISATNVIKIHKKRKYTLECQSSTPDLLTPSTAKNNLERNIDSRPQAKQIKLDSAETYNTISISSPGVSAANNNKVNPVSFIQDNQRNLNSHLSSSQSTNSPPERLFLQPFKRHSEETADHSHLQINQHDMLYGSNTTQLPNQHNVQQPTPVVGQLPTNNSLTHLLQQQNQQLRCENVQLQKQLSLFRQLIKNPQRLNQVIARLEQRVH